MHHQYKFIGQHRTNDPKTADTELDRVSEVLAAEFSASSDSARDRKRSAHRLHRALCCWYSHEWAVCTRTFPAFARLSPAIWFIAFCRYSTLCISAEAKSNAAEELAASNSQFRFSVSCHWMLWAELGTVRKIIENYFHFCPICQISSKMDAIESFFASFNLKSFIK